MHRSSIGVKRPFRPDSHGNRQGMLQGTYSGTKAAQLFVFDLLYTLLVHPRRNRPEKSNKLRTMNAPDMTKIIPFTYRRHFLFVRGKSVDAL